MAEAARITKMPIQVEDKRTSSTLECGRRWPSAEAVVIGVGAFVALVMLLYSSSLHAVPGNSDGATVILEGQAFSSGHLTLSGWSLSSDSFWSVDVPIYAIAVLIAGVRPELLHIVPAFIAAIVVIVGASMARDRRGGIAGFVGMLTVVGLLAFPSHALAVFFLQGPLHVGTALWCLLGFSLLRSNHWDWRWKVAVVLLGAGILGDFQMLAFGVVPLFIAGLFASVRTRSWRAGTTAIAASITSVVFAVVIRAIATAFGTFSIAPQNPIASPAQMLKNVGLLGDYETKLFGIGSGSFGSGGVPTFLGAVHIFGLLVVVACVLVALVNLLKGIWIGQSSSKIPDETWRLDDVLLLACLADMALFVLLTPVANDSYARYLTASIIFGSVLAGRVLARALSCDVPSWLARTAVISTVVVAGGFVSAFGVTLAGPTAAQPARTLGTFLTAHHLTDGIGDYWASSIVTVETGDKVRVRPVKADANGKLVGFDRNSSSSWYSDHAFEFLVVVPPVGFANVGVGSAEKTFGSPAHTYSVGGFLVLVWSHPVSVPPSRA